VQVPRTQTWFRGVSNIRGKLYSVADFAAFQGFEPIGPGMERRVILIHDRLIEGSAILVSRMLGLRNPETFTLEAGEDKCRPWLKSLFSRSGGTLWHELDLTMLVRETRFLEVGLTG